MSRTLRISNDLVLPLDAVTQTFAIMAKRGVGKTHTGSVMAEEMLKQGQPIVVYDPTSAWWGLKSSADGKRPGFPVVIFGGEHADVPLEETAGETIAAVIIERRLPAILDCGLMRKGARIRFMTAFCEALYHRNREPLHFFIDEAQTVAPQNLKAMPEIARLVGALEDIILQGRRRGLGVTVISPRPAILNTSIRSACEVLIAMQIVGPHDRKAIQEWVDVHGDDVNAAKEMMTSLSSLKRGEAWIWSPAWLELFVRTKFRARETFDSSATPKIGHRVITPRKMAEIDLAKLGAEIAATVERVKADDPRELRKKITSLESQLKAKLSMPAAKPEVKAVEAPLLTKEDQQKLRKIAHEWPKALGKIRELQDQAKSVFDNLDRMVDDHITRLLDAIAKAGKAPAPFVTVRARQPMAPRTAAAIGDMAQAGTRYIQASKPLLFSGKFDAGVSRPQQTILDVLASFEAIGHHQVARPTVAALCNVRPSSSGYDKNLSTLRTLGMIEYPNGGFIRLTDIGRTRSSATIDLSDIAAVRDAWCRVVSGPQADIVRVVTHLYPNDISREELADKIGISVSSSGYDKNLSTLRSLGAIDYPTRGRVRAADLIFPEALR